VQNRRRVMPGHNPSLRSAVNEPVANVKRKKSILLSKGEALSLYT
jgi:hypothetical protein